MPGHCEVFEVSDWQAEKDFWSTRSVDTFDLEYRGNYTTYQVLAKQSPDFVNTFHGDWVRSEDYRRDVERLEQRIKELESK